ncbi:MAG: hypothetical protein AAB348_02055, partial [Patescibacteria group bacterium]
MKLSWKKIILFAFVSFGIFFAFLSKAADQNFTIDFTVPIGGGGGGTPTNNPPIIASVTSSASLTTATVSWTASDDLCIASSNFVYGLTIAYGSTISISGTYLVGLSGLLENT